MYQWVFDGPTADYSCFLVPGVNVTVSNCQEVLTGHPEHKQRGWSDVCNICIKNSFANKKTAADFVVLASITGFFLFQAMLVMLHPLVSSQPKAQRCSMAGVRQLILSSSHCFLVWGFAVLSQSYIINIITLCPVFIQILLHFTLPLPSCTGSCL